MPIFIIKRALCTFFACAKFPFLSFFFFVILILNRGGVSDSGHWLQDTGSTDNSYLSTANAWLFKFIAQEGRPRRISEDQSIYSRLCFQSMRGPFHFFSFLQVPCPTHFCPRRRDKSIRIQNKFSTMVYDCHFTFQAVPRDTIAITSARKVIPPD